MTLNNVNKGDIVITAYGHDKILDKLAISTFTRDSDKIWSSEKASAYCDMINSLELKEGSWVIAKIVPENTPIDLKMFFPVNFQEIILKLENRAIQKVLREVDSQVIAATLSGANDAMKEKVFSNMSNRALHLLKEDMEWMSPALQSVRESQEKMLKIVHALMDTGEIQISE